VLGEQKKKEQPQRLLTEGFELTGIISDETKTKVGKDFYDLYYYLYHDYQISAKKIVVLTEEFSFARNTKIIVGIENEIIFEF
jgi:hypothetical protein